MQQWLRRLISLYKDTGDIKTLQMENPLLHGIRSLEDIANNITVERVWASQIEASVVRMLLGKVDVDLVLLEGASDSAANQLLAALNSVKTTRCIVMVRVDDCHYRYLRQVSKQTIFTTAWLLHLSTCMAMHEDEDDQLF